MRRIIQGKAYDTNTATRVADWDNGHNTSDFQYCNEELYKTPRGAWFLFGEGGAMSTYRSHHGNNTGWGEQIMPYTPEQAREWLEQRDKTDELEEYFGKVEDAGEDSGYDFKVRGLSGELHSRIKAESESSGKSMNSIILTLIEDGMNTKTN